MQPMDEGARLWTARIARENYWRVARWIDLDDLIQDGALHYQRIVIRYHNVRTPKHIMALYKRTFINHIHDLSKKRTKSIKEKLACDEAKQFDADGNYSDTELWHRLGGDSGQTELGALMASIARAPEPIKQVLQMLTTEQGRRYLSRPYRLREAGRETRNERLCRLIGIDPATHDLAGSIASYFQQR